MSFVGPHRVAGRGLSELLSAFSLCAKANSPSYFFFIAELPEFGTELSEVSLPKQYSDFAGSMS